jgi:cell division septum initiation protein DivIVA
MSAYEELMAQRGDAAQPAESTESTDAVEQPLEEPVPAAETGAGGMARLLEIAARNADELLDEAKAEAEQLTSTARVEAERLVSEARGEAERIRAEGEEERGKTNAEIANLRETERQHRERMQSHLQEMLAKVEANSIG